MTVRQRGHPLPRCCIHDLLLAAPVPADSTLHRPPTTCYNCQQRCIYIQSPAKRQAGLSGLCSCWCCSSAVATCARPMPPCCCSCYAPQSVKDMPIVQDMPPVGGFPSIRIQRRLPSTGPTGVAIFAVGGAVMAYGYYQVRAERVHGRISGSGTARGRWGCGSSCCCELHSSLGALCASYLSRHALASSGLEVLLGAF